MTRKHIILPHELAEEVRRFRYRKEIPSETEAIRRLIVAGLGAYEERPHNDGVFVSPGAASSLRESEGQN
jgi:metal-responsive CopG/Arc/MetJ family transcriptional regulator